MYDLEWEAQHRAPVPAITPNVAFMGAYYGEGPERLDQLFRSVRGWFSDLIVALQEPTQQERAVANKWCDVVLLHDKRGLGEASWPELLEAVRARKLRWVFVLDGDELADPSLLASLAKLVDYDPAERSRGVRMPVRSTIGLSDGTVLPAPTELNLRMFYSTCSRKPNPHSWIDGIIGDPVLWAHAGAIRQHRLLDAYLSDQLRYSKMTSYGTRETRKLLTETFSLVASVLGTEAALVEFAASAADDEVLDLIDMNKVTAR